MQVFLLSLFHVSLEPYLVRPVYAMAGLSKCARVVLFGAIQLFFAIVVNAQCNTDQNPYCAGNSQFEQICCTYPDICYWSNRDGTPACCQSGSDCRGDGGPAPSVVAFTAVQQTTYYVETVYSTVQPQTSTVVYYYTSEQPTTTYVPPPQYTSFSTIVTPAVVVVTDTAAVVAPIETDGVYVTVTQVQVVAGSSKLESGNWLLSKIVGSLSFATAILCLI